MANPDRIIGIDPGLSGAIAWVSWDGKFARVFDTPRAPVKTSTNRGYDLVSMTQTLRMIADGFQCQCAMELVHAMPGDGAVGAFSFGFGKALWEGMLASKGITVDQIDPRRWSKELGMEIIRDRKLRKDASRAAAVKFFPTLANQFQRIKDDGRAEALLIAECLRRRLVIRDSLVFKAEDMDTLKKPPVFEDASRYSGKGGGILKLMDKFKKENL